MKIYTIFLFLLVSTAVSAQWVNLGSWPQAGYKGDTHAIAVDPDGKVWASPYNFQDSLFQGDKTWKKCRVIHVFNPDGTPVSFSPIRVLEGEGIRDSLWWSTRGMKEDHEGNILYTNGWPYMYRINYRTGQVMNRVDLSLASKMTSPTAPGVDNMGNIYVQPVLPGEAVQMYDKDFKYLGNALEATPGFARTTEVSGNGLVLFLCCYTTPGVYVLRRSDQFSQFKLLDSLMGFRTEAANWNPATGNLWLSSGAKGYADPGVFGNYQLSTQGYYELDLLNKKVTDSLFWNLELGNTSNERQRGIAFSPDGNTAYIGAFGTDPSLSLIQKLVRGTKKSLEVLSPNGGEDWKTGTQQDIIWSYSGVTNVNISYSTNNGATWVPVISGKAAAAEKFTWTIPNTVSTFCKVRVSDADDAGLYDASNSTFTISANVQPVITVTSPDGGESWKIGTQQTIRWTSTGVSSVSIWFSTTNGINWGQMSSNTAATANSFNWVVPNTPSDQCKVKITDNSNASVFDMSNAVFSIYAPSVTITSPNGGETWKAGSQQKISWSAAGINTVKLEYSTNSGTTWQLIISGTDAVSGSYTWTVPGDVSTSCRVKVTDINDGAVTDVSDADFSIYKPSITLTSPNGGENWKSGTQQYIRWSSINIMSILIEFSVDDGASWMQVNPSTTAGPGYYLWTIPDFTSPTCRVRVTDVSDASVTDISNNTFSIFQASVTLIAPNGDENWRVGSQHEISWTSYGVAQVTLDYSTNNGIDWLLIQSNIPAGAGSYTWTIPNTVSLNCRVKVTAAADTSVKDISNNSFVIYKPKITVNAPNGGESWQVGTQQSVSWTSPGVASVKIEYTTDNGLGWIQIEATVNASQGSYTWTVPNTISQLCKIKITDINDYNVFDESNSTFIITESPQPNITVTAPNGGEKWQAGSHENIMWTSSEVANVLLEYSTDNGTTWIQIIQTIAANPGVYTWIIPDNVSSECRVRISDVNNPAVADVSNDMFTIYKPGIIVTSPNGGEIWQIGTQQNITWTGTAVTNLKIEYTIDDGAGWIVITENIAAESGRLQWIVPNTASEHCKIRLSDVNNPDTFDESDNVFTISETRPPSVTLLLPNGGEIWNSGTIQSITWQSYNVQNVNIYYSTNNGVSWLQIISNTASDGLYEWVISEISSENCRIRIEDATNSGINDASENVFTILPQPPAKPSLIKPENNSEQLPLVIILAWNSADRADSYDLQISTDDSFNSIIINESGLKGTSKEITVPALNTMYYWRVRAVNAGGAGEFSIFWNFRTINPAISITSPISTDKCMAGRVHKITWQSSMVGNVRIEYSSDDGSTWQEEISSIASASNSYNWLVPAIPTNNARIKITDNSYPAVSAESERFTIFSYPSEISVNNSISFPEMTQNNFRMVGIPGNVDIPVAEFMTGTAGTDWYVYYDNGSASNDPAEYFDEYDGSAIFNFKPGRGFWIISKNGFTVSKSASSVNLSPENSYAISVHGEWNIISNPFDKPVLWSEVQSLNSTPDPIKYYSGSYSDSPGFEPLKGYYWYNRNSLTSLVIPYNPSGGMGKGNMGKAAAVQCNRVRLQLLEEEQIKSEATVGTSRAARNTLDDLDMFAPPGAFEDYKIYSVNMDLETNYKYLSEEYRDEADQNQQFDVSVKSPAGTTVMINAELEGDFREQEVYLVDKVISGFYNLKETAEVRLSQAVNKDFMVLIGNEDFIRNKKEAMLPSEFCLYQNYPNPFNPVTTVRYAIPKTCHLQIAVFNSIGQNVKMLYDGTQEAGFYEIEFNGSGLCSGVYFYVMNAKGESGEKEFRTVRKMLMIK